jgi:amidase
VIELHPQALQLAQAADRERLAGRSRGSLHGIPILLKDNIQTGDGLATSAGSLALADWRAASDATVAARLRAAGALIFGKTNLSEWANLRSTHSISGWSGRGGQTRNPYKLERSPGGSSSGSAVAVSASLCAAALGSETDGSITAPASINGIAGLKPTVGLVSRAGIIPISFSQDTAGPLARTVRDLALLLNCMTGVDAEDAATSRAVDHISDDYTRFLDAGGLRGARLGVARTFFEDSAPLDRLLSGCAESLQKLGAEVIDPIDLAASDAIGGLELEVLLHEFKDGLNRYLARLPENAPVRTLEALIAFNEQHRELEMPFFEQEFLHQAQSKGTLQDPKYLVARRQSLRLAGRDGIDRVLAKYRLDAIVSLTTAPACYIDTVDGDSYFGGCTTYAAVAGYPHLSVPAGLYRGLPVGLSFFAGAWSESTLFKLAFAWEQAMGARRKPSFAAGISA